MDRGVKYKLREPSMDWVCRQWFWRSDKPVNQELDCGVRAQGTYYGLSVPSVILTKWELSEPSTDWDELWEFGEPIMDRINADYWTN